MLAGMVGEIDQVTRRANAGERGIDRVLDRHDARDDGAVVRLIRRHIEHRDALDAGDRVADRGNDLGAAALGKIRDELDQAHGADGRRRGLKAVAKGAG